VEAAKNSEDGMIRLARALDEEARLIRKRERTNWMRSRSKRYEDRAGEVRHLRGHRVSGCDLHATLSYGPAIGYGKTPYATDFAGMYAHATGEEPFRLPESILKAKSALERRPAKTS